MGQGGRMSTLPRPATAVCTRPEKLRKRLATAGFARVLDGKKRQEPPTPCTLDGQAEAQRVAMRLGKPPAGYGHGTFHLLADAMVALEVVEAISHETVQESQSQCSDTLTGLGSRGKA